LVLVLKFFGSQSLFNKETDLYTPFQFIEPSALNPKVANIISDKKFGSES